MRILGNGRVGIGTKTPTTILDVNAPMKIFGAPFTYETLSLVTNGNNFQHIDMINTNTGGSAGSGGLFRNDIDHHFQFFMGSASNFFVPDGAEIRTNGAGGMNICADSGIIAFGKSPVIGASEYARFVKSGNFGIGTTAPDYKLDVTGKGRFTDTLRMLNTASVTGNINITQGAINMTTTNLSPHIVVNANQDGWPRFVINNSANTVNAGAGTLFTNNSSHFLQMFVGATSNAFVPEGAEIRSTGTGGMAIVADSGVITFGKDPHMGTSEFARFTTAGKLGIGTQTPGQLLHVKNTASCCGAAIFEANFEALAIKSNVSNGFAGMRFYNHNGNTFAAVTGRNSDNALQIIADSSYISFWTGSPSSQRMDIIQNGNVGIGISNPAYNLDVNGKVGIHTIDSSSSPNNLLYQDPSTGEIKKTAVSPYKKYVALLSQTGSNAPTATILENTLGGTITWSRNLSGNYTGTLTGAFTANKTWFHVTASDPAGNAMLADMARVSANTIGLITKNDTLDNVDGWTNISIEIRVYP